MKCILYIQINNDTIPEMDLYQMYFNLYKENTTDKEILIIKVNKSTEDSDFYTITRISKITDSITKDDKLVTMKETVALNDTDTYLKELEKNYEVYNLIVEVGKDKLLTNIVDQVITINKGEFISPL